MLYDLKHLAGFDLAPLQPQTDLAVYTRDSVQLLVNKVFNLPREKTDLGPVAVLPDSDVFRLPRQKPIPKEKTRTRWQKFMEDKNMTKRKRSSLVWDEPTQDWKRRWGYKSGTQSEDATNFCFEVKKGDDPFENPFEKKNDERRLHMAKQKMRELRNQVEAVGGKIRASVPDLNKSAKEFKRGKDGLREAMKRAQISSASHGKFDRVAPNEKTNLQPKIKKKNVQQRSPNQEKDHYLKYAGKVLAGQGMVDKGKAANLGVTSDKAGKGGGKGGGKGKASGSKRRSKEGKKGKR